MKTGKISKLLPIVCGLLLLSCSKNDTIEDNHSLVFEYEQYGGSRNNYFELKLRIDEDSMHYNSRARQVSPPGFNYTEISGKTSSERWKTLNNLLDMRFFLRIENGSCRACVDSFDDKFSVIMQGSTYSVNNAEKDVNYQQIQEFFDYLSEQEDYMLTLPKKNTPDFDT